MNDARLMTERERIERARQLIKTIPATDRNQSARARALTALDELWEEL